VGNGHGSYHAGSHSFGFRGFYDILDLALVRIDADGGVVVFTPVESAVAAAAESVARRIR
jgi:hypothetical protein